MDRRHESSVAIVSDHRYRLGDYVELQSTPNCRCGMAHPVIREVLGRVGKVIYGARQTYPSLTLYYVFKNLAMSRNLVLNYQAIQRVKGKLDVAIDAALETEARRLVDAEFRKYFGDDLEVVLSDGVSLKSQERKKADFISEVAVEPDVSGAA